MNYIPAVIATIIAVYAVCSIVRKERAGKGFTLLVFVASVAGILAFVASATMSGVDAMDLFFMSSGWQPVLTSVASIFLLRYFFTPDHKFVAGKSFWILIIMFCICGAFFSLIGNVHHLTNEGSLLSISWILVLAAIPFGVVSENSVKKEALTSSLVSVVLSSAGVLTGWLSQYLSAGTLSLTYSVFMFGTLVLAGVLALHVQREPRKVPLFSILMILWFVANGVWMEFV